MGGPLQHWGMQGVIRAEEFVQFSGFRDPQTCQWVLQSKQQLMRPKIVNRVVDRMNFLHQHNDNNRVQVIVDGMPLFAPTVPSARMVAKNTTMLEDNVATPLANVPMSSATLHSRRKPSLALAASDVLFPFGPLPLPRMTMKMMSISSICMTPKTKILMQIWIFHRADHVHSLWS